MDEVMDSFVKTKLGSPVRVTEKSGEVNIVYEGTLQAVDAAKRTITVEYKNYKGRVDTVLVDNITSVNRREVRDKRFGKAPPANAERIIYWTGTRWFDEYAVALELRDESIFAFTPEGTEFIIPAAFCGTKEPQRGTLGLVDYQTRLATFYSMTSPEQQIEVPMDKVASIDKGVITPVV
ncbi:hypothetical protein [Pseudomonas sp. NPDC089734]|uniref:hypothetical protein n=1 Tax=Pseudomonas sp. NPDC089734 TaxID=3364469 RepID=UPI00381A5E4F